jgi:hypothetical protein
MAFRQQISKTIRVEVVKDCNGFLSPFYVVWKNSLGGWSNWMFDLNQTKTKTVKRSKISTTHVTDLAAARGNIRNFAEGVSERVSADATNLTLSEMQALQEIEASPMVYRMYELEDADGNPINRDENGDPLRTEIIPVSTSSGYDTRPKLHRIAIEFLLPRIYTQTAK